LRVKPQNELRLKSGEIAYASRMSTPHLPPEQAERVRVAMRELKGKLGGTNAALARALDRSEASVGAILRAANPMGVSVETSRRVAELKGCTLEALLGGTATAASPPDPSPARARALERLRGLLTPEVEEQVRSIVVHDEHALDEIGWMRLAMMHQEEHRRQEELRRAHGPVGPRRARQQ